jgi:hypothetical protein
VGEGGGCGRGCACGQELRRTVTGVGCLLLPEVLVSTYHLGAVDGSSWGKPAALSPRQPVPRLTGLEQLPPVVVSKTPSTDSHCSSEAAVGINFGGLLVTKLAWRLGGQPPALRGRSTQKRTSALTSTPRIEATRTQPRSAHSP